METKKRSLPKIIAGIAVILVMIGGAYYSQTHAVAEGSAMYATLWALVPPVIAIVLALMTKEVYSLSLIHISEPTRPY